MEWDRRAGRQVDPLDELWLVYEVNRYDAFLIDQWGVMHDGKKAYVFLDPCTVRKPDFQ